MPSHESRPTIRIPETTSHTIAPRSGREGHLRYLKAGTGAPLVLLHTVRTQAEHFRHLIPLIADRYTVYSLDLPGMGYSEIVPGASYVEPAMRAGIERLLTELDLPSGSSSHAGRPRYGRWAARRRPRLPAKAVGWR